MCPNTLEYVYKVMLLVKKDKSRHFYEGLHAFELAD
jgi:hypothetical protein